jgi:ketosteroid isomerase-like protein
VDSDRLADLERRLAALVAHAEITAVLHRYGAAVDYGDEAAWVDCFTEDATFEGDNKITGVRSTLGRGRAELARFVAGHTRAPELYHKHLVIDPVIEVDGDEASCRSYFAVLVAGPGGLPAIGNFGRYVDRLRREDDGRWRIAQRVAEIEAWSPVWTELRDIRRRRSGGGPSSQR